MRKKENFYTMNVIIVGCGRMGGTVAYQLYRKNHRVTIIDLYQAAFANLPADFRGRTMEGEALNQDVLHRAGIEQADAFIAATNSDSLNASLCHVARVVYKVPNVIARNYDPRWLPMLEAFNLQTVSTALWAALHVEELIASSLTSVLSTGHGEVEIYEVIIPGAWAGKALGTVLPKQCMPVAITRAGKSLLPAADTVLEAGDVIHVSATLEGVTSLRAELPGNQEA